MNCLSFDVGGTTIKYGVINNSYEVIHKDKIPTPKNEEKFIESLSEITVSYTHLTLPTTG